MLYFVITACFTSIFRDIFSSKFCRSIIRHEKSRLDWSIFVKQIMPTGILISLEIGLKNWSLAYLTVSLYTMVSSCKVLWILIFSLFFKLEQPRKSLISIIVL